MTVNDILTQIDKMDGSLRVRRPYTIQLSSDNFAELEEDVSSITFEQLSSGFGMLGICGTKNFHYYREGDNLLINGAICKESK